MVLVFSHSSVTKGGGTRGAHASHIGQVPPQVPPYGNCGIGKTNSNPPHKKKLCAPPLVPPHLRVPSYATDLVTIGIASPNVP